MGKGKIIIVSAPSGTGKSTIIKQLMEKEELQLRFSVSATNRSPREGETDGLSYHFLSTEEFKKRIADDAFVEYEEVYPGRFYGTLKSEVSRVLQQGNNLILDIDVKGGINVKKQYPEALSLFILPPSIETLRQRLLARATDDIETINQRVAKADFELTFADKYDVTAEQSVARANERIRESTARSFAETVHGFNTVTPEASSMGLRPTRSERTMTMVARMDSSSSGLVARLMVDRPSWKLMP